MGNWAQLYADLTAQLQAGQALGNEFITLLKDTSLITVIGGKEMTYAAKAVIAKTYQGLFPLFGIALMYLLLVMLFSKLLGVLERRLRQSDRR